MKNIISVALLLCVFLNLNAQEDKNAISADFFRPLLSDPELTRWLFTYERAVNERFSVVVGFEIGSYEHSSIEFNNTPVVLYTVKGSAVLLEGRFFPFSKKKPSPRGLFVGTYFKNFWLKEKNIHINPDNDFEKKQNVQVIGIDVGYKLFKSWFILEPVLGFGPAFSSGIGEDKRINSAFPKGDLSIYALRFAINVGVCF